MVTATKMGQEYCDYDFTQDLSFIPDVCSHVAACEIHQAAATWLSQDNDADIDAGPGYTSLMRAAYKWSCGAVGKVLASGADAASQETDRLRALHIAAWEGNLPVVELLLPHCGFSVNNPDSHGWTALHKAAYKGRLQIVELLLGHREINANT